MDVAERLAAIEEIRLLKARYFRFVDTKQWDAMAELFAPDATFFHTRGRSIQDPWTGAWEPPLPEVPRISQGRDQIMRTIRTAVEHLRTWHHGHMPEIEIIDERTARGVWAMNDELRDRDGRLILSGIGHYHESYERLASGWRFKIVELTRLSLRHGDGHQPG